MEWVNPDDFSEVSTVKRPFPDGIFCMDTALRYYGYSDRTPSDWHLAVSNDSGKSRFRIDHPLVKLYFLEPAVLGLGLTKGNMDGHDVRIYALTLSHGIALDPDDIGVIYDPVTDGIGQSRII